MKIFNKNIEEKKLSFKQNKNTYIKRISIVLSCFVLILGIVLFTFAKFETNSQEYTLINGKISDASSGDINVSYIVDGQPQGTIPAKGEGYKLKEYNCTNADGVWDSIEWSFKLINMSGKVKCNLEFETATSVIATINGAPGAVITFTDLNGNQSYTLNGQGKKENVEIPIMNNLTFTDTTVSKDPNNLSNNFTKTMNITSDTTDVYVMPDNALYWYGYNGGVEHCETATGWTFPSRSYADVTWHTNDVTTYISNSNVSGIGSINPHSLTTVHLLYKCTRTNEGACGDIRILRTKSIDTHVKSIALTSTQIANLTVNDIPSASYYPMVNSMASAVPRSAEIYGLWYE